MQGMYGAYTFPEKLLQKIWLRGDFDRHAAKTLEGVTIQIVHPGKWNLLGGPDFLGARLRFGDGPVTSGDVEVHVKERDWNIHGHARDPAYARVILHVVLFPPEGVTVTPGAGRVGIPIFSMLPLLQRSVEEFVSDEAVETLANRPSGKIAEVLGPLSPAETLQILAIHSRRRWAEKLGFARMRLCRLGWYGACHHAALEILGFRFNRAPMLRCAGRWSLDEWSSGRVDPVEAFESERNHWSLQGVRPANHPLRRLRQYADWVVSRPNWPDLIRAMAVELDISCGRGEGTRDFRRNHGLGALKRRISERIFAGIVVGTRADNLFCDGILPLLSAESGCSLHDTWHYWYPGDMPPFVTAGLRQLAITADFAEPPCHGKVQGLLGWLMEWESKTTPSIRPAPIA